MRYDVDGLEGAEGWENLPGWDVAHKGLNLYYKAILSLIVIVPSAAIAAFVAAAADLSKLGDVFLLTIPVAVVVVQVLVMIGLIKFTGIPPESGGKTLAWLAVIAMLVAVVIACIDFVTSIGDAFDQRSRWQSRHDPLDLLRYLGQLASAFGFFFLVLSTRAVSRFVGAERVYGSLNTVTVLIIIWAAWMLTMLIAPGPVASMEIVGTIISIGVAVAMIAAGIMLLIAVGNLRDHLMVGAADLDG